MDLRKCQTCYKFGYSCCKTQPVLTEEELAELYYKHGDLFPHDITINRVGNNMFVVTPNSIISNEGIHINKEYCIFFDKETAKCKVYEDRPKVCRDYGEVEEMPCPFKDITVEELESMDENKRLQLVREANQKSKQKSIDYIFKNSSQFVPKNIYKIPKIDKKLIKKEKELMLLSLVMYYLNEKYDALDLSIEHKYKLGINPQGKITAIRIDKLVSHKLETNVVAKLHNFLHNKILTINPDYLGVVIDKINRILKGTQFKDCEPKDKRDFVTFAVLLYLRYLNEYKNKSKEFTGTIKHSELVDFIKYMTEQYGGYDSDFIFSFNEKIRCIDENTKRIYNAIVKNK